MKDATMNKHMKESLALKAQIEALQKEKDKHDDAIKAELLARGEDTYEHGDHKVTYKTIVSTTFDRERFEEDHPGEYAKYKTKVSEYQRYKIA